MSTPVPFVTDDGKFEIFSAGALTDSTGVGPGKALANKVALAQTYYAVPDIQATGAVFQSCVEQIATWSGKKLSIAQAEALSGDAEVIMSAIACE